MGGGGGCEGDNRISAMAALNSKAKTLNISIPNLEPAKNTKR